MGEHFALTVFSICIQAAVGIMLFVAIGRLMNKEGVFKNAVVTATGLGIIGMLASLLHLGRPLSAMNALFQFGTSWLSREIWFTAIFVGLTVVAAVLLYVKPQAAGAVTGLSAGAALVGLIDVFAMARIYSSASVPVWQSAATTIEFLAAALSMGAMLFLVLSLKEAGKLKKIVALTVAAVVAVQVAVVIPYFISLGAGTGTALQASLMILGSLKTAVAIKWLFILAGAGLVLWLAKDELSKSVSGAVAGGAALILVGQVVGRYVFYAAMVVSGVGLT
ncbi:LOW QUALITY PROTEIN: anaerobic dimethyl sulfoxide reductase subunit C (anchor subunit) [Desulfitobacterium sp. LBE]|uniref:DMSO reductase n=3 Tax=Desulfitobacterium hafniense TaxID=49338 RepID=A0A0W1JPK9_DESHA|nr:DmsC/YnfH family molybdoenzyme membrane anchor subunit [Desulfitobacterium hafniense]ACL22693.1 anaerobic dimethyl sulfoxide reductase subunit C [Desulfitobacterium hafniense DCB-2]KTE93644.1 DMSO reductase [Desulfitobacterium hafniense]TWH59400.1 LOW QUALITY PROTEIN: anaerobic dimethyl sulfoxide reductase subunit C (anchor subunit) [Desulfitobacterium sp. LBE]BAE86611.1 putative anaerobic DMSO reductase chain C anchor subunit [Desulfitobacterium hafniense Y51]